MAKALAAIDERKLANIRLHHGDASELIAWLPAGSLARVDLIYPDPWPKRRHWKRRFVQDESIAGLARILRPGGEFRFATDIADYAAWTLARLARSPDFEWTAERADDWRRPGRILPAPDTKPRPSARAARPCYLIFRNEIRDSPPLAASPRPAAPARIAPRAGRSRPTASKLANAMSSAWLEVPLAFGRAKMIAPVGQP